MNVNLKDLIAALPQEKDEAAQSETEVSQEQLQEIFADLAHRPLPVGSLQRLWTAGELTTQIALAYLAYWVRQWFVDAEARKRSLVETNLRVALKMLHRLGYLRGAAAKLGQALGNLPGILPDQVVDTLDKLHCEAPPMHFSLLREMVRNELGKDPEDIFESFEKDAFAAASIGQVHRAKLKSGERVAVKIQYPAIARTIDSDLRNLGAVLFPARLGKDWEIIKAQFDEIHRMMKLEVDYEQEAANMRRIRALFKPDDEIVVPLVFDDYSTKRVLTTEYIPGLHLPAFLETNPDQALRNRFGTRMYVAWARMYYAQLNYADPHSGNYVFMNDGRLGLLDFGCIQHFNAEERDIARSADRLLDSLDQLPDVLRDCGVTDEQLADPDFLELVTQQCKWVLEPVNAPGPFDFGDETHLKRGAELLSELVLKRYRPAHPMFVYYNRCILGLRALLYRLRAQVNVGEVLNRERKK